MMRQGMWSAYPDADRRGSSAYHLNSDMAAGNGIAWSRLLTHKSGDKDEP